jgi:hypothetical protein
MFKKLKQFFTSKKEATGTNRYKVIVKVSMPFDEGTHSIKLVRFTKLTKDKATAQKIVISDFEKALRNATVSVVDVKETIQNS